MSSEAQESPAERYASLHAILAEARNLSGPRLERFLASACGDDESLRAQVEELLAAGADEGRDDVFADDSIDRARSSLEALVDGATDTAWLPEQIGRYRIVRRIGQGGMGIVYEATQESPRRSVAIKLLHPVHATPARLRRFRQEAELLGRLQHPGIAQIFEAGTYDAGRGPQPFIAMQLVDGTDLRTHCERHALDRAARIELLARVAIAVQYAHDRGVIHRDLKPENVLVNRDGEPQILDFGIARATDTTSALATVLTEGGQLIGTLAYMAPEQLSQMPDAITAAVDVYALGVLGFELLTGRLPRTVEDLPVSRAITLLANSEPPRAGQLDPTLQGDVETILAKALEHEPARRYASAAALAGDLRRHLEHWPIEARPPSRIYLMRKFTRRHRGLVASVAVILAVAITGALVAGRYAVAATRRADDLERASYLAGVAAASSAVREQDYDAVAGHLSRLPLVHRGWEYEYLRARLLRHDAEWDAASEPLLSEPVFGREGRRMFAMLYDGTIATWDGATGRCVGSAPVDWVRSGGSGGSAVVHGASLRFAAATVDDGIVIGSLEGGPTRRVDLGSTRPLDEPLRVLAWDAAGRRLLYVADGVWLWDGARSMALADAGRRLGGFSHAGDRVALASGRGIRIFDTTTGRELCSATLEDSIMHLAFAPDDATLAVAGHYRNAYLLEGQTLQVAARLTGHRDAVHRVAWTPDGSRVITTSKDGTLRIWSARGLGSVVVHATGERGDIAIQAVMTSDGADVVVVGERPRRFPVGDPSVLRGHRSYVYALAFSPDGSRLASVDWRGEELCVWDVCRAEMSRRLPVGGDLIAFTGDSRSLVAWSQHQTVRWDVRTGAKLPVSTNPDPVERLVETLGRRPWCASASWAISADGRSVAACRIGYVDLYDHPSSDALPPPGPGMFGIGGTSQLLGSTTSRGRLTGHEGVVYCAAFSPDGTRIATGGNDATVRIWDAQTCDQLLVLRGHEQYVMSVAFSPDGTLLASASGDATVRLWDTKPLHARRALAGDRR